MKEGNIEVKPKNQNFNFQTEEFSLEFTKRLTTFCTEISYKQTMGAAANVHIRRS